MKNILWTVILLAAIPFSIPVFSQSGNTDKEAIKDLFENTYLEVLCNDGDPQLLKKTFHPEFHMYVYYNNEISTRTFEEWLSRLTANRGKSTGNQTWKFLNINVTGYAAGVRLEIYQDGKIKYTDYFSLYKLPDGWKVFTKIFNIH